MQDTPQAHQAWDQASNTDPSEWTQVVLEAKTTKPAGLSAHLMKALLVLAHLEEDLDALPEERVVQTAALTQWALQRLHSLEDSDECQQKLLHLVKTCPAEVASAPGLDVSTRPAPKDAHAPRDAPQQLPQARSTASSAAPAAASTDAPKVAAAPDWPVFRGSSDEPTSVTDFCGFGDAAAPAGAPSEVLQPLRDLVDQCQKVLMHEASDCIMVVQQINRLGRHSREVLRRHFSLYGEVSRVLIQQTMVKPSRNSSGQQRPRPGGLGLVVMRERDSLERILEAGQCHTVDGQVILVERLPAKFFVDSLEAPAAEAKDEPGIAAGDPAEAKEDSSEQYYNGQGSNEDAASGSSDSWNNNHAGQDRGPASPVEQGAPQRVGVAAAAAAAER
ncbi:unnamed protein product [Prorocentrum cordatum]|uniref:RRM domain-containing protein n=1 Tax=Prorocentrum cordatum TaxID=2364126 RepID=A0ABN9W5V5_9DINO|nr:unnamed protein product [Polarella glacialis]